MHSGIICKNLTRDPNTYEQTTCACTCRISALLRQVGNHTVLTKNSVANQKNPNGIIGWSKPLLHVSVVCICASGLLCLSISVTSDLWNLIPLPKSCSAEKGPAVRASVGRTRKFLCVVCHPRERINSFYKSSFKRKCKCIGRDRKRILKRSKKSPYRTQFQPLQIVEQKNEKTKTMKRELCRNILAELVQPYCHMHLINNKPRSRLKACKSLTLFRNLLLWCLKATLGKKD